MKTLAPLAVAAALLAGCATNGAATIPSTSQANLSANTLQVAVGTANIAQDGTVGLNVVATLRQPNGASGVLADLPTLTGPSGFVVPNGTPGAYAGTNVDAATTHISGSPQVPRNNVGLINTTLGTFTGVFSYGFGPYNCDTTCTNIGAYYPGNPNSSGGNGFSSSNYDGTSYVAQFTGYDVAQVQPFFGTPFEYVVGPPAVPFFNNGTFPSGFAGYSPGFTTFEVTPVSGQYSLNVNVPAQNTSPIGYTATATLNAGTVLPTIGTPLVTAKSANGLSGTVAVPAGVTETEVYAVDIHNGSATFYTQVVTGTGTVNWSIPGNLGACNGSNCQSGANAGPTFQTGDTYVLAAAGFDYPAFEAGPPGNIQQKPVIAGANSQADVTLSAYTNATY